MDGHWELNIKNNKNAFENQICDIEEKKKQESLIKLRTFLGSENK